MLSARRQIQLGYRPGAWQRVLARVPWWLVIIASAAAFVLFSMLSSARYVDALRYLVRGAGLTIFLSITSYALALVLGLVAGLGRVSRRPLLNTLATIYVEVVRGEIGRASCRER